MRHVLEEATPQPSRNKQLWSSQPLSGHQRARLTTHGPQDVTFCCFLGARGLSLRNLSFVVSFNSFSVTDCRGDLLIDSYSSPTVETSLTKASLSV